MIWCPCYSHIRRKFLEAEEADFTKIILRKIHHLFLLEKVSWGRTPEQRLEIRQKKEAPIIDQIILLCTKKIQSHTLLPKSKLREALGYLLDLSFYLKNYTEHPQAHISNNIAERSVRPLAIGRKNWLFFGSEEGGEAAATLFSLVQTCRACQVNPQEYLEDVMRRLMSHNAQKLYELLPDQWAKAREAPDTS